MVVRKMKVDDIQRVYELSCESFSEPWSLDSIEKEMINPVASYFVAEKENQIVGFGGMWHVIDEGEIINIAVHRSYQRQGIGKAILNQLMSEARERKLVVIHLEVRASNEAARMLYLNKGFHCIATRKAYYHEPTEDALIMECRLS